MITPCTQDIALVSPPENQKIYHNNSLEHAKNQDWNHSTLKHAQIGIKAEQWLRKIAQYYCPHYLASFLKFPGCMESSVWLSLHWNNRGNLIVININIIITGLIIIIISSWLHLHWNNREDLIVPGLTFLIIRIGYNVEYKMKR